MSPLSLRRHRAERALREQFEALRGQVLTSVQGRLRASGVRLDRGDLEACYSLAWQGLYMKLLEGEEIANPHGWLALVTYRRALDEHCARARAGVHGELGADGAVADRDLAEELDDRARLRQLLEGLRGRLDAREREAAALCYLQGLSRAEAAARMGMSEARMRKLMEGRGPGRPGVAGKVGALVHTIRDGGWCEEQGSLMRALAYGVLDPRGERHRLALAHSSRCPACRAYVVSLRGLAVTLPPVFVPGGISAAILASVGDGVHAGAAMRAAGGGSGAGLQASRGVGGAVSATGAAGAGGAAGGGWLVGAGPFGAKLAVGCLLALGVGAGCVALQGEHRAGTPHRGRHPASRLRAGASERSRSTDDLAAAADVAGTSVRAPARSPGPTALTPAARVSREFGPEQASAPESAGATTASAAGARQTARTAAARSAQPAAGPSGSEGASAAGGDSQARVASSPSESVAAEREFSPG
jgi:DNA-directed RNA polymerase specialized sigma24 family protein